MPLTHRSYPDFILGEAEYRIPEVLAAQPVRRCRHFHGTGELAIPSIHAHGLCTPRRVLALGGTLVWPEVTPMDLVGLTAFPVCDAGQPLEACAFTWAQSTWDNKTGLGRPIVLCVDLDDAADLRADPNYRSDGVLGHAGRIAAASIRVHMSTGRCVPLDAWIASAPRLLRRAA